MDYMDPMSSVPKKADKLNLSLSLMLNVDNLSPMSKVLNVLQHEGNKPEHQKIYFGLLTF